MINAQYSMFNRLREPFDKQGDNTQPDKIVRSPSNLEGFARLLCRAKPSRFLNEVIHFLSSSPGSSMLL